MPDYIPKMNDCCYGMGKKRVNSQNISGMDITEKMKLESMNWLEIILLPPARSVTIGVPVMGGTAASRIIKRAMP